ncbi:MAG: hypothetical protein WD426_11205 [Anditalea sp.]
MFFNNLLIFFLSLIMLFSCDNSKDTDYQLMEMEFVLVDSITFDEQQILRILDYDKNHGLYLMVNIGIEGKYFLIDDEGNQVAENILSEGPDAFGMVLHRAGFVGDEILIISDLSVFVYDLDLKQLRKFPFEQEVKVRLIHWTLDYLSTFKWDEETLAVANLSDAYLRPFPLDYYDTLNVLHLINLKDGAVFKGGKLDEGSKMMHGRFLPGRDKPVFFSDPGSSYISVIFSGDSILYQYDPQNNFRIANKIKVGRMEPDQITAIPISEASFETHKQTEINNRKLRPFAHLYNFTYI